MHRHLRHDGANYIFALLTGYRDAPFGVEIGDGQYYNPYFPGGKIGMDKQLTDGKIDYQDGTPATASQMAKDVAEFLVWTAEPDHNDRRVSGAHGSVCVACVCVSNSRQRTARCVRRHSPSGVASCPHRSAQGLQVDVVHGYGDWHERLLQAFPLGADQGP